jgi:hypothetical protein
MPEPIDTPKIIDIETGEPPEYVDVEAFGRRFRHLLPGLAEDLVTLEKEGALYSHFWHEESKSFRYYRVRLLPAEIVQYVDASAAQQEFGQALRTGASREQALGAIKNHTVRRLVETYEGFAKVGDEFVPLDNRGCFASFLPRELEALVCGHRRDRYEPLPDLGDERSRMAIIRQSCTFFPVTARHLGARGRGRPPIVVETEYDVQDLLFSALRGVFPDVRYEDWAPQIAGRAHRIDLVFPDLNLVLEVKMIRNESHAKAVIDELMIDFESYHSHPNCSRLIAYVYDPRHLIGDPERISKELSGLRIKNDHRFEVEVIVSG